MCSSDLPRLLFGPAMNRAYYLESKVAKFPRIVVDPAVPKLDQFLLDGLLVRDSDDLMYVDYLNPSKAFYLVPSCHFLIQRIAEEIPRTPLLDEKRTWLVNKYNAAILGFSLQDFEARLSAYVKDVDANHAVVEDYEELLAAARNIRQL